AARNLVRRSRRDSSVDVHGICFQSLYIQPSASFASSSHKYPATQHRNSKPSSGQINEVSRNHHLLIRLEVPESKSPLKDRYAVLVRALTLTSRVCGANIQTIDFDPSAPDLVGRYDLNGPNRPDRSDYKRSQTVHSTIVPNRAMGRGNTD